MPVTALNLLEYFFLLMFNVGECIFLYFFVSLEFCRPYVCLWFHVCDMGYTGATCSCFHTFHLETVLSVCDVRVSTIDFGCHLEWNCPDANPKTTYTVQTKTRG